MKEWAKVLERVAQVQSKIDDGTIVLPDPGRDGLWCILDSGSSIDAADHSKHFPGSKIHKTMSLGATYQTATGEPFHNMGEMEIPFQTENRHDKQVSFNNAKVSMPILSMTRSNNNGHRTTLDDEWGDSYTVHKESGEEDPVVNRLGVYFMKIYVNKRLLKRPATSGIHVPEDFAGRGA